MQKLKSLSLSLSLSPLFSLLSSLFSLSLSGGRNGVKGESGASDDDMASEVMSHYSSTSENASALEDGTGNTHTYPSTTYLPIHHLPT